MSDVQTPINQDPGFEKALKSLDSMKESVNNLSNIATSEQQAINRRLAALEAYIDAVNDRLSALEERAEQAATV
ncbi:MAG: hypothetical protein JNN28_12545 [Saprospiraceae bacterium]|nr:hypothetical protein [Saprospiraceae bacterium]